MNCSAKILSGAAFFVLPFLLSLLSFDAEARFRDTVKTGIVDYSNELGFFQKANRELSDPRFMFLDDVSGIELGIGGTAQVAGIYTFNGTVENYNFIPSKIGVPQDNTNAFGIKVHGSEFHFKSRARIKNHTVIAFIKIGFDASYMVKLKQAYLSFDGFSVGMIPSFFNDLEYGVMSQASVNTQIDCTQPLIGYTFRTKKGFEAALAIEKAELNLSNYGFKEIYSDYQDFPDITMHLKQRWEKGHIQLGGVFRRLSYWTANEQEHETMQGYTFKTYGYGFSLSGNYKPTPRIKISAAAVAGTGIERYMDNLESLNLNVELSNKKVEDHYTLDPIPAWSVAGGFQYGWNESASVTSSIIGSYWKSAWNSDSIRANDFRSSLCLEGNVYWRITDYAYMGLAYFFGMKTTYPPTGYTGAEYLQGNAHRLMFIMTYQF